jgi:phosphatidylserine/phosphatidylglycerophosphate/cardiolipin synthase-like enzyme
MRRAQRKAFLSLCSLVIFILFYNETRAFQSFLFFISFPKSSTVAENFRNRGVNSMHLHQKKTIRKTIARILGIILVWLVGVGVFHSAKPLPAGVDYAGEWLETADDDLSFLYDLTYDRDGKRVHEQQIFDRVFSNIRNAEKYILIDMFLFNACLGKADAAYRNLSGELVDLLIEAKKAHPDIRIDVITDPINTVYGGSASDVVERLGAQGINVVITDLTALRDSNPLYSVFWRTFVQWFGNSNGGLLPHPFSATAPDVSLRSYLSLLNFKANHRKVFLADAGDSYVSVIMSANPHDASAAHSNVALEIRETVAPDLFGTEKGVASFSGGELSRSGIDISDKKRGSLKVRVLTEASIHQSIMDEIETTEAGDRIRLAMFYLSDRRIIGALESAAHRGVEIRMVLDPNKDAFGYEKTGIPNRPVAHELMNDSDGAVQVRWYDTRGEQFHSKMLLVERTGISTVILGSANYTRRNLGNYNLELDVTLRGDSQAKVFTDARQYFERIWSNRDGIYTTEYEAFQDGSFFKTVMYRIQEGFGVSSF